ncbi:hypothetical protein CANMA_001024 [Candida margitis]|uniref:uncharacterized protein n=1 Tax=Candida margitis TaxID=1775924 RepID=UPI0022272B13|nr:uncharacterized protein CANMA_001024 [Candida margitis]KAI5969984.1 hypothetical protein CANMA_001024 [Candida margitis]
MHRVGSYFRRPSFRRSRGIALAILIIGLVFILGIHHPPIKHYLVERVPIPQLRQYFMTKESPRQLAEFDEKFLVFIEKQKSELGSGASQANDAKVQLKLELTQKVLRETNFTTDASFNSIIVPPREEIPQFQKYDPRFTFGLLLRHINEEYKFSQQTHEQELSIPVFHWADYVDMSPLEEYILKTEKQTCQQFDVRSPNQGKNRGENLFDPDDYCIDDGDPIGGVLQNPLKQMKYPAHIVESMKSIQQELANSPALSTGFHIHRWTGRSTKSLRPVISRSYLYDFMPPPLTLTFLLPGDKAIHFNVDNQGHRKKLRDSDLLQVGEINIKDEITKLAGKISKPINAFPFETHLKHEDFVDMSREVVMKLEAQGSPQLNQTDQHYLSGLKYSLQEENAPKHFHEANIIKEEPMFGFGSNYDWRFFTNIINKTPLSQSANSGTLKAFLRLTNRFGIRAWVSHGSLLSWYWNGLRFPWEPDVSVQMPIQDLHRLTRMFNQSVVVDFGLDMDQETRFGRYYLDVASFISQRTKGNTNNVIDARFIDLDTGVKIDITALAVSDVLAPSRYYEILSSNGAYKGKSMSALEKNTFLQVYNCRKEQFVAMNQINPLRLTMVQGEFGYIPCSFESIMMNEYSLKGTVSTFNNNYVYLPKLRIWTSIQSIVEFLRANKISEDRLDSFREGDAEMISVDLSDKEYIEYLYYGGTVLREFLNTREMTSLHNWEVQKLMKGESTKHLYIKSTWGLFGSGSVEYINPEVTRCSLYVDYFVNQTRHVHGGYSFEVGLQSMMHAIKDHEVNWKKVQEEKERKKVEEDEKKKAEEEKKKAKAVEEKEKAEAVEEKEKAEVEEKEKAEAVEKKEKQKNAATEKVREEQDKKNAAKLKEIEDKQSQGET